MTVDLHENQHRYIKREDEYKGVVTDLETKIKEFSTRPLELEDEKTEDQHLLEGRDIHDPVQNAELMQKKRIHEENKKFLDGNTGKYIKEIHKNLGDLHTQIDKAQSKVGEILKNERAIIWEDLDQKLAELKKMQQQEADKKKENQYDFKEREKELTDHLETMTQVAQDVDNKNRKLTADNQEFKIQYLSQENDRDILIRQLIFQKKESAKMRENHMKLKKQVDQIKEAEKQDTIINEAGKKPATAGVNKRNIPSNIGQGFKSSLNNMGKFQGQENHLKRPNTTAMA